MKKYIAVLLFVGCSGSLAAQTTLKRYKKLKEGSVDNQLVTISVSSATASQPGESTSGKTVFDLSERGQAAVLTSKSNDATAELLNKKFQVEQKKKAAVVDLTTRNISITFSIRRNPSYDKATFSAYDRIENLDYNFTIDNTVHNEVKFTKWNKYTTEYGTLDIGTLEYNQSVTANLDLGAKVGASASTKSTLTDGDNSTELNGSIGPEASVAGKWGYSKSRKENQSVKQRYIQLTGTFGERKFQIHQQGTRETELAGNVSIDLTIKLPPTEKIITSFSNLYGADNSISTPGKVKMVHTRYKVPDMSLLNNGIIGNLSWKFAVRHIVGKANTFPEYDDKINFITGKNNRSVTLIKEEELKVPIYFISVKLNGKTPSLEYQDAATTRVLQFLSYDEAEEFRSWLINTIPSLGKNNLKIMGKTISFEGIPVTNSAIKRDYKNITVEVM